MNRSFDIIGKISRYENWNLSLIANGIDEISFDVHKYEDGKLCPLWDELIDLKIVDADGFGRFEISVSYTDNTETVKSIHGQSLEVELAQIGLYEFHVNDEEATAEYSKDNYDSKGNYMPTTFYRKIETIDTSDMIDFKRKHSLLDRVLADKAPHWSIGHITSHIALNEESQPEPASEFQRTYTVNGDSIYDFLTGTVAEESNVVFIFDTIRREINCYSLCDCIDQKTGSVLCNGIGEDTTVLVSKNKLANEITITSNKDSVKNCFRIEGGDDIITDMVRAANMNGSSYISLFADFQYRDMSSGLKEKLTAYQDMMSSRKTQEEYYGENGIYTRLCKAYDDLYYYESSMMPNTSFVIEPGKAQDQYKKVVAELKKSPVAVSSMNNYDNNLFIGVTNNIEAYAQIFLDSRFDLEIISETTSYSYTEGTETGTWKGKLRIKQHTDEKNVYPADISTVPFLEIKVNDNSLDFAKQKIQKALSKGSMLDVDFETAEMTETEIRNYFNLYSLNRLKSFSDGYNSCISILTSLGQTTTSDVRDELYAAYEMRYKIVEEIREERQNKVNEIHGTIEQIKLEQKTFQYGGGINDKTYVPHDFKTYIGDAAYLEFCRYRREDTYKNDNYISDGKSTSECLEIAKRLIEAATNEVKKACVLQRTVSTSLNNLFALPEFEPLYDKFALFNYIRIRTEDELLKLRLIGIEFNGESASEIQVTFSEQVESIDGTMSDLQNIIQQAGNMATSYPSTVLQAKKGSEAKLAVSDMFQSGLNAAKTMLTNNDNNEVTITPSGIICRRMDDEGFYGDKQIRITGNIMAFTEDNWKSVALAIGETTFINPVNGKSVQAYGIIADNIVGNLIAGDTAIIGNKDGSVQITGDGIKITNGTITWGEDSVNAPEIENINGLKNSLTSIEGNLEQLDGRIQTYSQPTDPKTTGSTKWNNSDNEKHLGDVWVNTEDGVVYVFSKEGSTYKWTETQDSNLKALALSKAQVFTSKSSTISNGYSIGDLWILESDTVLNGYKKGTVLIASANAGKNNTFNKNHWQEATVKNATDALEEVTVFKGEVNHALMGDATTSIGKDYVISPKIGGGYMYITGNNGTSIEINPKGTEFDGHNGDYVFNISKDDKLIMGVDNEGNGHFSGKITGSEISGGKVTGAEISGGKISGVEIESNNSDTNNYTGIYNGLIFNKGTSLFEGDNSELFISGGSLTFDNTIGNRLYLDPKRIDFSGNGGNLFHISENAGFQVDTESIFKSSSFEGDVTISGGNLYVHGEIIPFDNLSTLGTANYRWNEVYTSNSSITTSDRNLKENIKPLSKKHIDFFRLLAPVSFTFKNGNSGRTHIGFISQDVEEAMNKIGLTDLDFAGFCKDIRTTVKCDEDGNETEEPELDENGNVQYIYSLRYGEFIALNTYMIQSTMNKIDKLEQENKQLEERLERLETLVSNYTN